MDSYDNERARFRAYGDQLISAHLRLREMVEDLYVALDEGRDLHVYCMTLCGAVTKHHKAEDANVFPLLAARHPELEAFLRGLRSDHNMLAHMLGRLERSTTYEELDAVSAVLETHFIGEEKRLVSVLNALEPMGDLGIGVTDGRA
ncbi:hemerythrin domain-containing protein [Paractinoplanes lichenicola]|uniref:Hemerythrin domain-containing protein n=1 Tax=Paractinoplanes lichenicola TaxID=2802976 RepID=A0ABS1W3D2_9ACTN|nr:hemerythrin domain-containing protein [Actinoplanes lichenicola]MBL7261240.1 hemerythrin domain-containing protein [Actinoplanes lichenicola]